MIRKPDIYKDSIACWAAALHALNHWVVTWREQNIFYACRRRRHKKDAVLRAAFSGAQDRVKLLSDGA